MNKIGIILVNYLMILLLVLHNGCSLGPTAGTETGNPDITACLNAVSELFDTSDLWIPSRYLTEGEQQLNPQRIIDLLGNQGVAKCKADSSTDSISLDTVYSIVVRIDTVVVVDTLIRNDTIIIDTLIVDSITENSSDDIDVSLLIARYIRHDSILVRDTVIRADTQFIERSDTIWNPPRDAMKNGMIVMTTTPSTEIEDYTILRDSTTGEISQVQTVSFDARGETSYANILSPEIHTGISYLMISHRTTSNGQTISEAYHYSGNAEFAASGSVGATETSISRGTITYASPEAETTLEIDFDAGIDGEFSTTSDNRIYGLLRRTTSGMTLVDYVRYGRMYFGMRQDTVFLQRDQTAINDSVANQLTNYRCVVGSDVFDHHQNRLIGVYREIELRNRDIKKIIIMVTPDHPLITGETTFTCGLSCTIDYGKGLSGTIDAVSDYGAGIIRGSYAQAGEEYDFIYYMTDRTIEITPRN